MIVRTEALVLRKMDYRETSQIVTLFTRKMGKISVLAKGARTTKSRFGSTLQPMSYTQVVFYYKPNRQLQTLSESSHLIPFHHIARDLDKIALGLRVVELTNELLHDEGDQPVVFNLVLDVLQHLNTEPEHAANLWPYFQLKMAAALGFGPTIIREDVVSLPEHGGRLALATGHILPIETIQPDTRRASRATLRTFAILARAALADVLRLQLTPTLRTEIEALVSVYIQYHLDDLRPSQTAAVVDQMNRPPRPIH